MKIIEFNSKDENYLEDIASLRAEVWAYQVGNNTFSGGKWKDKHDEDSIHWGVITEDNRLIAAARLCIHDEVSQFPDYDEISGLVDYLPGPIGMMTRLVVHPEFQKMGISKKLDKIRIEKSIELGAGSIMLQVPTYRRKSIESFGFECMGMAVDETFAGNTKFDFYLYVKYCHVLKEKKISNLVPMENR